MTDTNSFALAGISGWPVAQSRSPVIQNFWLRRHGIAGRYVLLPIGRQAGRHRRPASAGVG